MEDLMTPKDVQRSLKVSLALVYRWAERGQLPCVRIPCPGDGERSKALVRFEPSEVRAFIERHRSCHNASQGDGK